MCAHIYEIFCDAWFLSVLHNDRQRGNSTFVILNICHSVFQSHHNPLSFWNVQYSRHALLHQRLFSLTPELALSPMCPSVCPHQRIFSLTPALCPLPCVPHLSSLFSPRLLSLWHPHSNFKIYVINFYNIFYMSEFTQCSSLPNVFGTILISRLLSLLPHNDFSLSK